ncbi:lambda exonuclease family protein [Castellaniella sp. WN]
MSNQGSEEWFHARLGRATASNFADVLAKGPKGGESLGRQKLKRVLALERITGTREEGFSSADTRRGQEQEPFARIAYIARTGRNVIESDFIPHPTMMAGASPDGLIEVDGLFEAKRQVREIHIEVLLSGEIPSQYVPQVQGNLWIAKRNWCDFVSYNETLPEPLNLVIVRVMRDEGYIKNLEIAVAQFLIEVDEMVKLIQKKAA